MPPPTTRSRIPPLLETYLRLPRETSLILLTGVLHASANWLVVKYLSALLPGGGIANRYRPRIKPAAQGERSDLGQNQNENFSPRLVGEEDAFARSKGPDALVDRREDDCGVVLVSWMRDWEFWSSDGRKIGVGCLRLFHLATFLVLFYNDLRDLFFKEQQKLSSLDRVSTSRVLLSRSDSRSWTA